MRIDYFQGEDGSYAVLTVMDHQLDADLNYYDPDILLHIENCGRGIAFRKFKMTMKHPLSDETFPGCHVLIQSGEVENQGEVEGFEGDVLFAPPQFSSSRFTNDGKNWRLSFVSYRS